MPTLSGPAGFAARSTATGRRKIHFSDFAEYAGKPVTQPSYFVAGERDPVRRFIPGVDLYQIAERPAPYFRSVIVPRVGHWVQQEAPDATNAALEGFLAQLELRDRLDHAWIRVGGPPAPILLPCGAVNKFDGGPSNGGPRCDFRLPDQRAVRPHFREVSFALTFLTDL